MKTLLKVFDILADKTAFVPMKERRKQRWKGEEMSEALLELLEPLIQKREREARKDGISQGISQGIRGFRSLGHSDQEIKRVLTTQYGLTEKAAEEYLQSVK